MAIARDSGAAYPLVAGSVTNTATLQVNGVVTSAADTYIIVKVAWGQGAATVTQPVAVTWVGGAPAGCSNFECWVKAAYTVASTDATGISIWVAKATQAIASSKSVLVTAAASALVAASMSVDAITGSSGPGEVASNASNNGSTISRFVTIPDVAEGSWLFTAGAGDNPGGVTPQTNTTEEDERIETTNNAIAAVGTDSTGTKRGVNVGWTGSQAWFAIGALEMRASGLASVGPFSSGRQRGEIWSGGFWAKNLDRSTGYCGAAAAIVGSVAASYLFPSTGPQTYNETLTEAGSALDSLSTTAVYGLAITETATAADALAHAAVWAATLTEAASALDTLDVTAVWPNFITEAATAAESLAIGGTWNNSLTEAASALDALVDALIPGGGGTTYNDSITEAASALDALTTTAVWPNALTEAAAAADALDTAVVWVASLTEAASAADNLAVSAAYAEALTEAVVAAAAYSTTAILNVAVQEAAFAVDNLDVTGGSGGVTALSRWLVSRTRSNVVLPYWYRFNRGRR